MNKVMLIGRVCNDIELRYTSSSNKAVANFSLAVDRKGSKEKQTDFFNIIAWNKTAEFISKYFNKGKQVAITGRLQSRNWTDNNGQKRNTIEVIAEEVDFADTAVKKQNETNDYIGENTTIYGDELPF